jgi:hypothetical protein
MAAVTEWTHQSIVSVVESMHFADLAGRPESGYMTQKGPGERGHTSILTTCEACKVLVTDLKAWVRDRS